MNGGTLATLKSVLTENSPIIFPDDSKSQLSVLILQLEYSFLEVISDLVSLNIESALISIGCSNALLLV